MSGAWNPEEMGFNKHKFFQIDPDAINPEDYAQNMRGEQDTYGEVREYNSAFNDKHPENDVRLEDMARIGTVFSTDAEGYTGNWIVSRMPKVRAPLTFAVVSPATESPDDGWVVDGAEVEINTADLGLAVDETNNFKQVASKILKKGKVDKHQRERLTKR